MIFHRDGGDVGYSGAIEPKFLQQFARVHEEGGFDRVLIGYGSSGPDGWAQATWAAAATDRLGFLVAHRPGFVVPTLAARKAATIDQLSNGRIAVHVITGGSDAEEQRDGDFLDKDTRYRRTAEYIDVLKRTWTSEEPFDHEGEFYRFKAAFSAIKPVQQPHIPVFFGGSSDAALAVGARQADVWATWGEPVAAVKEQIDIVRGEAAKHGRSIRISVSVRPIMASTEEAAWERAYSLLARAQNSALMPRAGQSVGSQRLLKFAAEGDVLDKRLFTAIARATGATGSSTALVGTPDQVAESLLDYYDVGADILLIRGFDPYQDAIDYGRDLLPIVHAEVKKRDAAAARTPASQETK